MTAVFSCTDKLSYHGPKNRLFQSVGNISGGGLQLRKNCVILTCLFLKAMHMELFVLFCSFTDSTNLSSCKAISTFCFAHCIADTKMYLFWMRLHGNDHLHEFKFTVQILCQENTIYLWKSKWIVIHTHAVQTATLKLGQGSILHASWQQVNCDTLSATLLCNWQQYEVGK